MGAGKPALRIISAWNMVRVSAPHTTLPMTPERQHLSAAIAGEGTLPLQCAALLVRRGHRVVRAISPDAPLRGWAAAQRIPHSAPGALLGEAYAAEAYDYLFYITGSDSPPPALRTLPRQAAISLYIAPLPHYAGSFSTSWAIMQRETSYGVTWCEVGAEAEAGAILFQHTFDLEPGETALTLNARCYDAAIRSFAELIEAIETGALMIRRQDYTAHPSLPLSHRPPRLGLLDWSLPGEQLDALVRGLHFGPLPNTFGAARCLIGGEPFVVVEAALVGGSHGMPPGRIVAIERHALIVSTATRALALRTLETPAGQRITITGLAEQLKLRPGDTLTTLDGAGVERLSERDLHLYRHEHYWVNRLEQLLPVTMPYLAPEGDPTTVRLIQPLGLPTDFASRCTGYDPRDLLAALFALYLARTTDYDTFDMAFYQESIQPEPDEPGRLYAAFVPLRAEPDMERPFADFYAGFAQHLADVRRCKSYLRDLVARQPSLREHAVDELLAGPALAFVEVPEQAALLQGSPLLMAIAPDAAALVYDPGRLAAADAARIAGHLAVMLKAVFNRPDLPVGDLPLLSDAELQQLRTWNDTAVPPPTAGCIHQLVEAQSDRTPEAAALLFEDEVLSYAALEERANRLAHYLRGRGVGPDTLVGVYLPRSPELVISLLAVLKAGGAYLPLDPAYPVERTRLMLADAGPVTLITLHTLLTAQGAPLHPVPVLLDTHAEAIARCPALRPEGGATPGSLAYLIYTSGSTGQPEGVLLEHAGVVNQLCWRQATYPLDERDTVLQTASAGFDISVWEFFGPLSSGARLAMARLEHYQGGVELTTLIERYAVTVIQVVPSLLRLLLSDPDLVRCAGLRHIFCGGEPLSGELQDRCAALLPGATLHNLYGPTETTIEAAFWDCRPGDGRRSVPIGRPIANKQLYIVDRRLRLLPVGVPGELLIGGAGLARGYLNQPTLTVERFVEWTAGGGRWTVGSSPSLRVYRSGDRARYLEDGVIEFIGRSDQQVKVRGYRVEPAEIEALLLQHPAVAEVAVVARDDECSERRLLAYLTLNGASVAPRESIEAELRAMVSRLLPEYMAPSAYIVLEAMPLTLTGKLDRRALPIIADPARPVRSAPYVAPRNPVEEQLAQIWAQTLAVASVGVYDNFFALGGDSIIAIQIVARANQAGLQIAPRHLFSHQSIAQLAALAGSIPPIEDEPLPGSGPAPLTPIQAWFFEQHLPEPDHWNMAMMFEVPPDFDTALLERALAILIERHDALRLRFSWDDIVWQRATVDLSVPLNLLHARLSGVSGEELADFIAMVAARLQVSMQIQEGCLLQAAHFQLASGLPGRLLLVIHHLAVDGVSWRILQEDLATLCEQFAEGRPPRLPPRTTSFRRWAQQLALYAHSPAVRTETAYWLAPLPPLAPLPLDLPGTPEANTTASARTIAVAFEAAETRALLVEAPPAYHTQINDLLLAALALAFAHWSGTPALMVDIEGHGREELIPGINLSRTVGWFSTLYPVCLQVDPMAGAGANIKAVKEQLRRVPNQGIGYGLLRYLAGDEELARELRARPRAEIFFSYQGQLDESLLSAGTFRVVQEPVGVNLSPRDSRSYLIEVQAVIVGGRLCLDWIYSSALHHEATIRQLARRFFVELRTLVDHCRSPGTGGFTPSDFPLARLNQAALDRLTRNHLQIEDLYPLTPTQRMMLAHDEDGTGVYMVQRCLVMHGDIDVALFRRACRLLLDHHPALRSFFRNDEAGEPLQLVRRSVRLPWATHDWRELEPEQRRTALTALLEDDLARGFDLAMPPLLRLTLIYVADQSFYLIWTYHHLLMDGNSATLLVHDLIIFYRSLVRNRAGDHLRPLWRGTGVAVDSPRPYRDYIAWLQTQDSGAAEQFWRAELGGVRPAALPQPDESVSAGYINHTLRLSVAQTNALQEAARLRRLTLPTLVQGALALALARVTGAAEVVLGLVESERPAALPGSAAIVGPFTTLLPLRVIITPTLTLDVWLATMQERHSLARHYGYVSPELIQSWSGLPKETPLFACLLSFQPLCGPVGESGFELYDLNWNSRWHYPLTVTVTPGLELTLRLTCRCEQLADGAVAQLLAGLRLALELLVARPEAGLDELITLLATAGGDL